MTKHFLYWLMGLAAMCGTLGILILLVRYLVILLLDGVSILSSMLGRFILEALDINFYD